MQGGSVSPLLANIYLHYVFDLWVQRWQNEAGATATWSSCALPTTSSWDSSIERTPSASSTELARALRAVRAGAASRQDAPDRVRPLCGPRPARPWRRETGDLQLSGLHAQLREDAEGKVHGAAADDAQRWQAKLQAVKTELRRRMHQPVPEQGAYLRAVVLGHVRYYGVPMNGPRCSAFRMAVGRLWWRVLRRRSQRQPSDVGVGWSATSTRWLPHAPYLSSLSAACALASSPKARAGCGNAARPDLWRG